MTSPLVAGMVHLEAGRLADAERAFAAAAGPSGDGVIARFRRAESLSRLLRHDEAVDEARRAAADAPDRPSTALWLAWTLAEAGRCDEAASVAWPAGHEEFLDPVRDAYRALAVLARPAASVSREERAKARDAILAARHGRTFSLALRLAESARLASEPRWPDPPAAWFVHCCRTDLEERGVPHPAPPVVADPARATRSERRAALRWLREHAACAMVPALVAAVRSADETPEDMDELEAEMLLAHGELDACDALLAAVAARTAPGELGAVFAILSCRAAQLRGRAARPADFPGGDEAARHLADDAAWIECCAALLDGRPADARAAADRIADPSRPAYVEASLRRWADA